MKRKIDVEKLLQWALREELPKGRPVSLSPWEIVQSYGMLGARIQTSGGGVDQFGFVPGAPHEDALTIAAGIAKLPTLARFESDDDIRNLFADHTLPAFVPDEWIAPLRVARFNARDLVISKATTGTRPPWKFECATPHPVTRSERNSTGAYRDKPVVNGLDDDGHIVPVEPTRTATKRGVYDLNREPRSPLAWDFPSPIKVGEARGEYLAWYAALASLADDLRDALQDHEPTVPAVAWRPWLTGQTPPSRILDNHAPAGAILPLKPQRPKAGPPVRAASEYESAVWRAEMAARSVVGNAVK